MSITTHPMGEELSLSQFAEMLVQKYGESWRSIPRSQILVECGVSVDESDWPMIQELAAEIHVQITSRPITQLSGRGGADVVYISKPCIFSVKMTIPQFSVLERERSDYKIILPEKFSVKGDRVYQIAKDIKATVIRAYVRLADVHLDIRAEVASRSSPPEVIESVVSETRLGNTKLPEELLPPKLYKIKDAYCMGAFGEYAMLFEGESIRFEDRDGKRNWTIRMTSQAKDRITTTDLYAWIRQWRFSRPSMVRNARLAGAVHAMACFADPSVERPEKNASPYAESPTLASMFAHREWIKGFNDTMRKLRQGTPEFARSCKASN